MVAGYSMVKKAGGKTPVRLTPSILNTTIPLGVTAGHGMEAPLFWWQRRARKEMIQENFL